MDVVEFSCEPKEPIHQSSNSTVYTGTYETKSAILKVFPQDFPSESVILSYQRDHTIGSLLYEKYPENFSQPLKFVDSSKLYVIKSQEGVSLSKLLQKDNKFEVDKFLHIAIRVCENLHLIHSQNIVHCDIKPENILYSEKTNKAVIIDFESSFLVSLKNPKVTNCDRGTFLYMSPEQTGRTQAQVDKTSDIYSLGITFFRLLTGTLPFEGDLNQVVYSHIAKQPPTLKSFNSSIPDSIEDIVQKMIKKNQNERYLSIVGVKKELEFIKENLHNPELLESFKAGQYEVDDIFKFEDKLYGRNSEVELLKQRLRIVEENTKVEMCMIRGWSGIGKSRLVDEILVKRKDNISKDELNGYKNEILSLLEKRAKIITNLIPESSYILGEDLEDVIDLPSENDEQKRFISTLIDLFRVFSTNGRVLMLFLDDLQWADSPSLSLIEQLLNESEVKLFIIGAYRDNEVTETHPLMTILQPVLTEKNMITITLDNLELKYIEDFLSDSLKSNQVSELSKLVFNKTNGNPFFVKEFLLTLYDKNLISFDYKTENWIWDLDEISATKFSDNVVDFMVENLKEYSETTKNILSIAACIGNTFSIELLCMVYDKSPQETYKDLLTPITLGWIIQKKSNYQFVHDRLQQAAYEIFTDKQQIHLKIGMKFLENAKKLGQLETFIFDIVNNLNEASDIVSDRNELISLNLLASKVSAKNYAFEPALKFSSFARSLLPKDSWDKLHDLTFEVNFIHANNYFVSSRLDEATEIYQELINNSQTNFEALKTTVSFSKLLLLVANFPEAIKAIFEIFGKYDISKDMPQQHNEDFVKWSNRMLDELLEFFTGKESGNLFLEAIPEKANEEMSLLSRFLLNSSAVFYQTAQPHFATATQLIGVKLGILYGNNEYLPVLMTSLSWHAQFYFKKSSPAIFGRVSQDLEKSITSPNIHLYVKFYSGLESMLIGDCTTCIRLTEYAYKFGFNIGEFNWGSYSCFCWMNFNICNGANFLILQSKSIASQKAVYNARHPFIGDMMESSIQTMNIILGKSTNFDPVHAIPGFINFPFGRFNLYSLKALSLYLLKDYKSAKESLEQLLAFPDENIGLPHYYDNALYSMLIDYNLYQASKDSSLIENMKKSLEKLKQYSEQNPIYFECRYLFGEGILKTIQADIASNSEIIVVFNLFENAIQSANKSQSKWIEALVIEFFADFCSSTKIYQEYSKYLYYQAHLKWKTMGVLVRSNALNVSESFSTKKGATTATVSTTSNTFGVDIQTIVKSSNAVSEDLEKKNLLLKLNQVIVENAGATRGFIILKSNDKYVIASEILEVNEPTQIPKEISSDCNFLCLKIFNQCVNQREMIFYRNALKEENLQDDEYIRKKSVKSVLCSPIVKGKHISGVLYLENNSTEGAFTESKTFILKHVLSQVAISIENSNLYEDVTTINQAYARFFPKEFLKLLEKKDIRNIKQNDSVEKKMTILFSDIRNFTSMTDKMDAKESFEFVNNILSEIAPCISSNHGFVDKFIGDCVMAIFPDSPLDAVISSFEMLRKLKKLNQTLKTPINIGIGIAYGNVMIGTLGYEQRLDATVISSTVNTASRMESLTTALGVSIVVTQEIYERIKNSTDIVCYSLGTFYLKGQENPKELFEVLPSDQKDSFNITEFSNGIELFKKKNFKEAIGVFASLGSHGIANYYIKVCELYSLNELPNEWNGEIKLSKDGDPLQIVSDLEKSVNKIEFIQQMMNDPVKLDYLFECAKKLKK